MFQQMTSRFSARGWMLRAGLVLLAMASIVTAWQAAAQEMVGDLGPLVSKVDPCVVTISLDNQSSGSGFVIDPEGLVATNYHVIEGAKSATVTFANKKTYPVEGFVAIDRNKDLALLRIKVLGLRDQKLACLQLADGTPEKGERVFAFGAPMGLSGSVSDGLVAAVRPGRDVRDTLVKLAHRDIYGETLGYDLDIEWIQTTAPISQGNSGGPLVNVRGEVVGVNTWVCAVGQNLNFSLSVVHLTKLMESADATVQSLVKLPAARPNREGLGKGDAQKTLEMWKELNRCKVDLQKKAAGLEKSLQRIVPVDPRNTRKGLAGRNRRKAALYDQLAKAYYDHAATVKALDSNEVDGEATLMVFIEAEVAQRVADLYRDFSLRLAGNVAQEIWNEDWELQHVQRKVADLRTGHDLLRIKLSRTYDIDFPTLEETAKNPETEKTNDLGESPASNDAAKPAALRVWTDHTGRFQIQAKYRGTEAGRVQLEKADGSVIAVPLESLSEADRRFIGEMP